MTVDPGYYYANGARSCGIPEYMVSGLVRWFVSHTKPGDFLCAVLQNDLRRACERADDTNAPILMNYMRFLYNYAPSGCWGSQDAFDSWRREEYA